MKAADVAKVIESHAPLSSGMEGDELGYLFGSAETPVRGVATCWSPTLPVIEEAEGRGCNMIVAHEPLFYQKRWSVDAEAKNVWIEEAEDADKVVNKNRAAALERMGGCVFRCHTNWDPAPRIGIIDALIKTLKLGPVVKRGRFVTLHEVKPILMGELAYKVQKVLDTDSIRVTGRVDRYVSRVATLVGGLGQMFNSPEEPAALGADVIIAGECLAYTLHYALELGVCVIEAGHCAIENPGMRAMAEWLNKKLKGVEVVFLDSGKPWKVLY